MSLNATLPVATIDQLGAAIKSESANLQTQLTSLRARVARDPSFQGSAAAKYDEYIQQWQTSQTKLIEALDGAGGILQQFSAKLQETDQSVAGAFNV